MTKHPPQTLRDGRDPGWFYLDDALIDQHGPTVGAIGVAVYATLARHAKTNGSAVVGYGQVAKSLHIARNTVISTLRNLADAELITITPQTDDAGNSIAANIYTLCVIPEQKREKQRRGVPTGERGVPTDAPPHAPSEPPVPTGERGVPTDAYIGHDHVGSVGSVGDRARAELFTELRKRNISRASAQAICLLDTDDATILTSIDNLYDPDDPKTMGRIIQRLLDVPPERGKPYERQSPRDLASRHPPAGPADSGRNGARLRGGGAGRAGAVRAPRPGERAYYRKSGIAGADGTTDPE